MLVDVQTLRIGKVRGAEPVSTVFFSRIGRYWVGGADTARPSDLRYVNWRTGERRSQPPNDEPAFRDLDSPALVPVVRPAWVPKKEGIWDVEGSVALTSRGGALYLRFRKGSSRSLSKCRQGCDLPGLSAGLVSWATGDVAYVHDLDRKASSRWTFPEFAPVQAGNPLVARHTQTELLVAVDVSKQDPARTSKIFAVRL